MWPITVGGSSPLWRWAAMTDMPMATDGEPMYRLRLGDCSVDGCLRDAYSRVTLKDPKTGESVTGLVCDEHAKEIQ